MSMYHSITLEQLTVTSDEYALLAGCNVTNFELDEQLEPLLYQSQLYVDF